MPDTKRRAPESKRSPRTTTPTPSKSETAAAPIPEQMTHPEANPYYDAFEAQIEAAKRALLVCRFVTEGELAAPVQSGSGHVVISQEDIEVLKSAFLVAAHIAYGIRRRLERGALVEDGRFCLGRDRLYQQAHDFFQDDPALWGDFSASADGAGILVLEHVPDLGYDPASADWWPIMRSSDDAAEENRRESSSEADIPVKAAVHPPGEDDGELAAVESQEMEGLRMLQRSDHWLNSYIGGLLCDFGAGHPPSPNQVFLALADSIEAIEGRS